MLFSFFNTAFNFFVKIWEYFRIKDMTRHGRVTFLSTDVDGNIPDKYKITNIIEPDSIPECRDTDRPYPKPDEDIIEFPASFWPPADTVLVGEDTSAEELWDTCRRNNTVNRAINRSVRAEQRKDNVNRSNCAEDLDSPTAAPDLDIDPSALTQNEEVEKVAMRLERLPEDQREDELLKVKEEFNNKDFKILKMSATERSRKYIAHSREAYETRGVGPCPNTDNPNVLCRELKRRVGCQENGQDWTSTNTRPRKPPRQHDNAPDSNDSQSLE